MPRKRALRRLRRVRVVGRTGAFATLAGASAAVSAASDAVHHRPGGVAGVIVCLALVASGIGGVTWALRNGRRVAAQERQELRAHGLDDGLPIGAFLEGQQVGLEASDKLLLWGTFLAGVGAVFAVSGAMDPSIGWRSGLAFGSVGFLPAAALFRAGTGTRLWLTTEGIERRRWPRKSVRWADVERILPMVKGSRVATFEDADLIELQTRLATHGRSHLWGLHGFTIRAMFLEISATDLVQLIHKIGYPTLNVGPRSNP